MINQIATKISLTTIVADLKHFDRGPKSELESVCLPELERKETLDSGLIREQT